MYRVYYVQSVLRLHSLDKAKMVNIKVLEKNFISTHYSEEQLNGCIRRYKELKLCFSKEEFDSVS